MKFSITFKYSNVTFKNKETKETITYDSKAEGNSFAFDNVDEDVVLGIVKGIKDRKSSQVFSYDDLRTNFINTLARNKCKELYDKLDKGDWKVEDVAVSTITIKDLEFTKPTMNAREALTVESKKMVNESKFKEKDEVAWYDPEEGTVLHGGVITEVIPDGYYKVWFDDEEMSEVIPEADLEYDSEKYFKESKNTYFGNMYDIGEQVYYNDKEYMVVGIDATGSTILYDLGTEIGMDADWEDIPELELTQGYFERRGILKEGIRQDMAKNSQRHMLSELISASKDNGNDHMMQDLIGIYEKYFGEYQINKPFKYWECKKFNESLDDFDDEDPEWYGDGQLHVFDYGEDCPFAEQYIVMYPSGSVLYTSHNGSVSYWDDGDTMSYSTQSEMEDNFTSDYTVNGEGGEYVPHEVDDPTTLPDQLKKVIIDGIDGTGYDIDKDVVEFLY